MTRLFKERPARGRARAVRRILLLVFSVMIAMGALSTATRGVAFAEEGQKKTLADVEVVADEGLDPIWYVVFTIVGTGFFLVFVSPFLFPRAKRSRQRLLLNLVDTFPFLTPLIDPDARAEEGMGELRDLAHDVNELERHKDGALKIDAQDYGRMALPSEETVVDRERPDIPVSGSHEAVSERPEEPNTASLKLGDGDDEAETQSVAPLSERLKSVEGDDEVPFDAVHPSAKPQMAPLDRKRRPIGGEASDSKTISVVDPPEMHGDELAAQVLRESGAFGAIPDDDLAATIIRDSPAHSNVDESTNPQLGDEDLEETHVRTALQRPEPDAPDETLYANVRAADDPDATTTDYESYDDS